MSTLYSDAVTKVELDLDLEAEDFVQPAEMLGYFNEARREAEAELLGVDPDYFLDNAYLPLVTGTSKYALPTGIYARKIRNVIYANGDTIYEIRQIRSKNKFIERAYILQQANSTDFYQYMVLNNLANGIQIELSPPSREDSSTNVTIWYVRKLAELTGATTDYIDLDIPEATNFIYAYVKARCKQKENGGQMPPDAQADLDMQKKIMVDALATAIVDDDNEVIKDVTFYQESS